MKRRTSNNERHLPDGVSLSELEGCRQEDGGVHVRSGGDELVYA